MRLTVMGHTHASLWLYSYCCCISELGEHLLGTFRGCTKSIERFALSRGGPLLGFNCSLGLRDLHYIIYSSSYLSSHEKPTEVSLGKGAMQDDMQMAVK